MHVRDQAHDTRARISRKNSADKTNSARGSQESPLTNPGQDRTPELAHAPTFRSGQHARDPLTAILSRIGFGICFCNKARKSNCSQRGRNRRVLSLLLSLRSGADPRCRLHLGRSAARRRILMLLLASPLSPPGKSERSFFVCACAGTIQLRGDPVARSHRHAGVLQLKSHAEAPGRMRYSEGQDDGNQHPSGTSHVDGTIHSQCRRAPIEVARREVPGKLRKDGGTRVRAELCCE